MGEVIKFPIGKVRRTIGKTTNGETSADILVFEGVRYSSHEQASDSDVARPVAEPGS